MSPASSAHLHQVVLLVLLLLAIHRGVAPSLRRRGWRAAEPTARMSYAGVCALLVLVLAGGTGAVLALPDPNLAVVVDEPVTLRISPFEAAAATGSLPEGTRVQAVRSHGNHVYVRTADDGTAGWVDRTAVERLIPS